MDRQAPNPQSAIRNPQSASPPAHYGEGLPPNLVYPWDEPGKRPRGAHAECTAQQAGEHVAAQREADREHEVRDELHLAPDAPWRRHQGTVGGIQTRIDQLVLRLVTADRRREHGRQLGCEHESADEDERPVRPPQTQRAPQALTLMCPRWTALPVVPPNSRSSSTAPAPTPVESTMPTIEATSRPAPSR